jgi:hypothetical protein
MAQPTTIQHWTIHMIDGLFKGGKIRQTKTQRPVNQLRVGDIAGYITTNYNKSTFIIGMAVVSKMADDTYNIIDGQHRLHAIYSLNDDEKNILSEHCFTLTVDVRNGLNIEDEQQIFRTINLSIPLGPLLDDERLKMFATLENWLAIEYKTRLSLSPKPIMPNMNLVYLMEKIKSDDVISELWDSGLIDSANDVIKLVKELNEFLGTQFNNESGYTLYQKHADSAGKKHTTQYFAEMLNKIESKGKPCYLGLIPKYRWITFIGHHNRV